MPGYLRIFEDFGTVAMSFLVEYGETLAFQGSQTHDSKEFVEIYRVGTVPLTVKYGLLSPKKVTHPLRKQ